MSPFRKRKGTLNKLKLADEDELDERDKIEAAELQLKPLLDKVLLTY